MEICPSDQTSINLHLVGPPHTLTILFVISYAFGTYAYYITPTSSSNPKKCSLGPSWVTFMYLWTEWNSTLGEIGDKNTTHYCKCWITILLSSLKTLRLSNLMVSKELWYFFLISAKGWMNMERKVSRESIPSVSVQPGAIFSKKIFFCMTEKLHVNYLIYKKYSTELST